MRDYNKEIRELEIERDKINRKIYELEKERNYAMYKLIDSLRDSLELTTSENERIKNDGITYLFEDVKKIIENEDKVFG